MFDRVELDGLSLLYEERRSEDGGTAIVFVHGLGGSIYSWWPQLDACEEAGLHVLAYDQRGAGLSAKPPGPYSVAGWAEDVERLLDELSLERVTLVGQSVGCMIAEQAALRLGDRVNGLMVIGGALRWRPEAGPVFEERVRLAKAGHMETIAEAVAQTGLTEDCRQQNPALSGLFRELIASNDPDAYAEWAAATAGAGMITPEELACPALVACGEHDPVAPPAAAEAMAAAFPNARVAVIEGAAHWCQLEAPQAVSEALLGFVREIAT